MKQFAARSALVVVILAVVVGLAITVDARGKKKGDKGGKSDITVMIVLANGETITYSSEVRGVQLVLDDKGRMDLIHLILAKGKDQTEKNTHEWYNFDALAGFSYRYHAITGKAMVTVARTGTIPGEVLKLEDSDRVPILKPLDYQ